jgi:hypothetical protein
MKTPKLQNIGLFATPTSMSTFQEYLSHFNGSEAAVAQTGAWMAYNLAGKQTEAPEGSVDVRLTKKELGCIIRAISYELQSACGSLQYQLTILHRGLNKVLDDETKKA